MKINGKGVEGVNKSSPSQKTQNEEYRRLTKKQIEGILKGQDILKTIKPKRLIWYGHILKKEKLGLVRKMEITIRCGGMIRL